MTQDRTRLRALAAKLDALFASGPARPMTTPEWEEWAATVDEAQDAWREATDTATVLALLDERDALLRERDEAREMVAEDIAVLKRLIAAAEGAEKALAMIPALKAERDALAADARRYRRLRECIIGVGIVGLAEKVVYATRIPALHLPSPSPTNSDIDAAIDALDGAKG